MCVCVCVCVYVCVCVCVCVCVAPSNVFVCRTCVFQIAESITGSISTLKYLDVLFLVRQEEQLKTKSCMQTKDGSLIEKKRGKRWERKEL